MDATLFWESLDIDISSHTEIWHERCAMCQVFAFLPGFIHSWPKNIMQCIGMSKKDFFSPLITHGLDIFQLFFTRAHDNIDLVCNVNSLRYNCMGMGLVLAWSCLLCPRKMDSSVLYCTDTCNCHGFEQYNFEHCEVLLWANDCNNPSIVMMCEY